MPTRLCILLVALTLAVDALGCAKLTPSHGSSGWRSDGLVSGDRKAPERVRVLVLEELAQRHNGLLWINDDGGADAQSAAAAIAAEYALKGAIALTKSQLESAGAQHVSSQSARTAEGSFYDFSAAPEVANAFSIEVKPVAILVTRELAFPNCRAEGLPVVTDMGGAKTPEKKGANLEWCVAFMALFDVESDSAPTNGFFQLKPAKNGVALFRSRAKVVDPSFWAPWTWMADDANNRWWAPTKGDKNYLDELEVELTFKPVEIDYLSSPHLDEETEVSWTFKRIPFRCADGLGAPDVGKSEQADAFCTSLRVAKAPRGAQMPTGSSEPLPVVPIGMVLSHRTPQGPGFKPGQGGYVLHAKITEADSQAERYSSMKKLVQEHEEEAVEWVKEKFEPPDDPADAVGAGVGGGAGGGTPTP